MLKYIVTRLGEASTWRGIAMIATMLGMKFSPEQANAIMTVGLSVVGALGAFLPDLKK